MKYFRMIPWTGVLLLLIVLFRVSNLNLSPGSVPSIIVIVVGLLVLVLEFIRSGDIQFKVFIWDLTLSLVTVILASWYYCYLFYSGQPVHFVDYTSYTIMVIDAWLSPINGFRTALRNLQIGDNSH